MSDTWIAEGNQKVGERLPNANDIRDNNHIDVWNIVIDVPDEKISNKSKEDESWEEAQV